MPPGAPGAAPSDSAAGMSNTMPPRPQQQLYGAPVSSGSAASHVVKTMENLTPKQVYLIMREVKGMVLAQPDNARQLLTEQPQLCYAFLQALLRMNMIDPALAESMISAAPPPPGESTQRFCA